MASITQQTFQKRRKILRFLPLYLMAFPGMVYLFINNYIPMAGMVVAFKNFSVKKGIFGSDWVGFKNFKYLFMTPDAWVITRNTIGYNLAFIIFGTSSAVIVAILLSEMTAIGMRKLYQSVVLLPHLISMVIISYLVFALLSGENGFLNKTVLAMTGADPISWYNEPKYWPVILLLTHLWYMVGYNCIVYVASIMGFDRGYYEAACIEGAGKLQQIWRITLPLLRPIIVVMVMIAVGRIFYSDFGLFYQVPRNSGLLFPTTNVIDTYVFRGLLQQGNISMSSAAGVYQSVVGFVVVLAANLLVKKVDKDSALF